jgi:prolyl oligopeptidase
MKTVFICLLLAGQVIAMDAHAGPPPTEPRPVEDRLHGDTLVDPFRWLEGDADGNLTEEVEAWTDAQNAHTRKLLDGLPGRKALESRLRELMEVPEISAPGMFGTRYFYDRREGGQAQARHYVRESLDGEGRLLLDPEAIDPSGLTAIAWTEPSNDGKLMAFGTYRSGDENYTLYVLDVDSGNWLAEEIPGRASLLRWLPDGSGFYYVRLEDPADPYSSVVKLHQLGRHHRQDPVLFRQQDLEFFYGDLGKSDEELELLRGTWGPGARISRDDRWMVVHYWTGTDSVDLWVADLEDWRAGGELKITPMIIGQRGRVGAYHFRGDTLLLENNIGAANGQVSMIDLERPAIEHWRALVPEDPDKVVATVDFGCDVLAVDYLVNAQTRFELYDYNGKPRGELELPGIGSAGISSAEDRNEAFLVFTSFNTPRSIYHLDLVKGERTLWARPDVPVDPKAITVEQVWYPSRDGTMVSMFLVYRKGLERDGRNPTILYGYGGFDISMTPNFIATLFPWFEGGGIYAVANLRGGGEYGAAWHEAGMLEKKQNVFDDFIAAGEWLIEKDYTSNEHLGIAGGSNGGLLTGATVVQRPDLFSAAISAVPLLDMLRYQDFLMARYWVPEYGSAENAEQYRFIRAYSPYHNVGEDISYPAVFFTAGENDARVHPMHARKMAALMQARTGSNQDQEPILLWVDRDAGHGQGKPLDLQVRDVADQRIFMMWQLGMLNREAPAN